MNAIYWHWTEKILMKEPYIIADQSTSMADLNQHYLANVHRGLNTYGWINMYDPMGKLLREKKLLGRQHSLANLIKDETKKIKKKEDCEEKIKQL